MKAIVYRQYGLSNVVELQELDKPVVAECIPLAEAARARGMLERGGYMGKMVLIASMT